MSSIESFLEAFTEYEVSKIKEVLVSLIPAPGTDANVSGRIASLEASVSSLTDTVNALSTKLSGIEVNLPTLDGFLASLESVIKGGVAVEPSTPEATAAPTEDTDVPTTPAVPVAPTE